MRIIESIASLSDNSNLKNQEKLEYECIITVSFDDLPDMMLKNQIYIL